MKCALNEYFNLIFKNVFCYLWRLLDVVDFFVVVEFDDVGVALRLFLQRILKSSEVLFSYEQ